MEFQELVLNFVKPLNDYSFAVALKERNLVRFQKQNLIVEICYEEVGYEISVYFSVDHTDICVPMTKLVEYYFINRTGLYQLPDQSEQSVKRGIEYTIGTILCILKMDTFRGVESIKYIYSLYKYEHKELLKKYYINEDLEKADNYWKNKNCEQAYHLYKKCEDHLSRVQLKRFQYLKRKM